SDTSSPRCDRAGRHWSLAIGPNPRGWIDWQRYLGTQLFLEWIPDVGNGQCRLLVGRCSLALDAGVLCSRRTSGMGPTRVLRSHLLQRLHTLNGGSASRLLLHRDRFPLWLPFRPRQKPALPRWRIDPRPTHRRTNGRAASAKLVFAQRKRSGRRYCCAGGYLLVASPAEDSLIATGTFLVHRRSGSSAGTL